MPRFSKDSPYGYDLTLEHRVFYADMHDLNCVKYILGTNGSFILVCPTCGEERFRTDFPKGCTTKSGDFESEYERCFQCKTPLIVFSTANRERIIRLWGDVTSVEERKADRLQREQDRPLVFKFGSRTESDFPLGYVEQVVNQI